MSTRSSIKWDRDDNGVGFHLYEDVLDESDGPVYLDLDGLPSVCVTASEHGHAVTIAIPREWARKLGLLP